MHSTDDMDDGYFGSGQRISRSIKKHGREAHSKEVLEFLPSREALKLREKQLVNEDLLADPLCMNLKLGGEGGWVKPSPETYAKAGRNGGFANRAKWTAETIARVSAIQAANGVHKMKQLHALGKIDVARATAAAALPENVTKRKVTYAERGHMQGEKNSQFGSCWVTNDVKPIKIKKEQLDEFLLRGYRQGRK
jgi:hypothetical protein